MSVKDLTGFITPNLELKVGDKTYVVTPPSRDAGKIMMAINVVGVATFTEASGACEVCGRSGAPEVDATMQRLVEENAGRDLGELSLGDAYSEMVSDGLDGGTLSTLELYAFYYWTLGEAMADEIIAARDSDRRGLPKGRKPSKSGRSSG